MTDLRVAPYCDLNGVGSAGQMMTNVSDLTKWLAHIMRRGDDHGHRLFGDRSRREMLHPGVPGRRLDDWAMRRLARYQVE